MRRIPRNAAGIGCKGGTSATAGRKSVVYSVTLPDGREERARIFKVTDPEAVAHCHRGSRDGRWYFTIRRAGAPAPHSPEGTETATVPARAVAS